MLGGRARHFRRRSSVAGGAAQGPIDRKETLVFSVSDDLNQFVDAQLFNPFLMGNKRTGWHFAFEPLYYYNPWYTAEVTAPPGLQGKDGETPYLATSYQYNQDFTELTLKLRQGVTWSDGQPFTSK